METLDFTTKEKEGFETSRQRRKAAVLAQEEAMNTRNQSVFINVTRRITDGEKRLVSFITKFLGIDLLFDMGLFDLMII